MNATAPKRKRTRTRGKSSTATVLLLLLLATAFPLQAQTIFTVTNLNDSGPGSLRQFIEGANFNPGADVIVFAPGLTGSLVIASPLPDITDAGGLIIDGDSRITVSGNNSVGVFTVNAGASLNLQELTVSRGIRIFLSGLAAHGGGIHNNGTLTLTNSTLSGNGAIGGGGGGIYSTGTVTLTNSTLSGNGAYSGGGIYNEFGTVTLINSTLSGNGAGGGGGIYSTGTGTVTLINSTLSGNSAFEGASGGGIRNSGTLTLTNSTVSGNSANAGGGGGIENSGTVTLTNSTLSGNSAVYGGGIRNFGTLTLTNSLIANSPSGGDCVNAGTVNDNGHNLVEDGSCISVGSNGNLSGDPLFVDATNGNFRLQPASPAINAGSNQAYEIAGGDLDNDLDLAGNPRVFDGTIDMGAYEFQGEPSPVITLTVAEGWRMLSSPIDGLTYDDMLGDLWTQGFPGADYEGDANTFPNVYTWPNDEDGTDQSLWEPVGDLTDPIPAGTGFLMYVFEDDNYGDNTGWSDKTIMLSGATHTGDIEPEMNSTPDGWTLVGNPYGQPIEFSALIKVNLVDAAYVYDLNAMGIDPPGPINGNGGAWRSISGSYGDIPSGNIAPGQGFFVQNTDPLPSSSSLTFTEGSKTSGGEFYGKKNERRDFVRLEIQGESLYNSVWIRFSEDGSVDPTAGEALELQPLSQQYAVLGARKANGTLMDIAHFPLDTQNLKIPLVVEVTQSGQFTIRATDLDLPAGMSLYLYDRQTGESIPLGEDVEYMFDLNVEEATEKSPLALASRPLGERGQMVECLMKSSGGCSPPLIQTSDRLKRSDGSRADRFLITTLPGEPASELPDEITLGQNYPNPFNPSTVISYQLPVNSQVRLDVYDMLGRNVATLVDGQVAAGTHQVNFDASNLSSGVYLYRLEAGSAIFTKKLTLIK